MWIHSQFLSLSILNTLKSKFLTMVLKSWSPFPSPTSTHFLHSRYTKSRHSTRLSLSSACCCPKLECSINRCSQSLISYGNQITNQLSLGPRGLPWPLCFKYLQPFIYLYFPLITRWYYLAYFFAYYWTSAQECKVREGKGFISIVHHWINSA